jgi:hypothetical protein
MLYVDIQSIWDDMQACHSFSSPEPCPEVKKLRGAALVLIASQ